MNSRALTKRVDNLAGKIGDEPKEHIAIFDVDSFSVAEKVLLCKFNELIEKYNGQPPVDVLKVNDDLISKANEVVFKYALGTFRFVLLCQLGNPENKVDNFYFNILFGSFLKELIATLKKVHELPLSERQDFEMFWRKKAMKDWFDIDIESGNSVVGENTEYSEDNNNEHYDRV